VDRELWTYATIAFAIGFLSTVADARLGKFICVIEALLIFAMWALIFTAFGFAVIPRFVFMSAFPWIGFYAGLRFNKWRRDR